MPIDLDDPSEADRPVRRRRWVLAGGAAVVIAGVIAAVIATRDESVDVADSTTTVPVDTVPDTEPDVVDVGPAPPAAFPDSGSDHIGDPLREVYSRTTADGITVHVQLANGFIGGEGAPRVVPLVVAPVPTLEAPPGGLSADVSVPADDTGGGWVAPAFCNPTGWIRVTMTYRDAVGVSQASAYDGVLGPAMVTMFSPGQAEGTPFRVLVVQVADTVSSVAVGFEDGRSDVAEPVNGWAALAVPGRTDGRFALSIDDGGALTEVGWQELAANQPGGIDYAKACTPPPPELPPPGAEQPADPAAAEQSIRERLTLLVDRSIDSADKPADLIDDPTGIDEAREQLDAGGFAETARTARYTITDLVFTSATEAWFLYDLETDVTSFTNRFGLATFIDGSWRISRRVLCQDFALASVQCVPAAAPINPPA